MLEVEVMPKKNVIVGQITGLVAVLAAACYFLLGFTIGRWDVLWLVFLAIPVTAIIGNIATKNKDISGSITGIVAILAAAAYFILGFSSLHLGDRGWLVFLAIPLTAIIADMIKRKSGAVVGLVAIIAAIAFILIGFFVDNSWHIAWVVFLLIPITAIINNIVKTAKGNEGEQAQGTAEEKKE
jgi:hypothetical protein